MIFDLAQYNMITPNEYYSISEPELFERHIALSVLLKELDKD